LRHQGEIIAMAENPPPQQQQRPPLEDPLHEKELFASEVVGAALVHGNVVITLASVRFDEPAANSPPKPRRVITSRIVLTSPAAGQLLQNLQQLASQIEAKAAGAAAGAGAKPGAPAAAATAAKPPGRSN
jgi:hypothetical protein